MCLICFILPILTISLQSRLVLGLHTNGDFSQCVANYKTVFGVFIWVNIVYSEAKSFQQNIPMLSSRPKQPYNHPKPALIFSLFTKVPWEAAVELLQVATFISTSHCGFIPICVPVYLFFVWGVLWTDRWGYVTHDSWFLYGSVLVSCPTDCPIETFLFPKVCRWHLCGRAAWVI